jgi:YD repeat-containing protein
MRSTYDLNGNKTADIDTLGRTTSYAYDALNRLTPDPLNRLSTVTDNWHHLRFNSESHEVPPAYNLLKTRIMAEREGLTAVV